MNAVREVNLHDLMSERLPMNSMRNANGVCGWRQKPLKSANQPESKGFRTAKFPQRCSSSRPLANMTNVKLSNTVLWSELALSLL
jgi:hypothetical protein